MAEKTLLEMVQEILSDMDSDEVNSINDTVEATQVAGIVRSSYEYLTTIIDLPTEKLIIPLTGLADSDHPNYMRIPDTVNNIEWVKYSRTTDSDSDLKYEEITYLTPKQFHAYVSARDESATDVDTIEDFNGTKLLIKNNVNPTYYTTFDDTYIIFDSYDSDIDSTLQESKSVVYGSKVKTFTLSDSFVPDLPDKYFPQLIAEAKADAFAKLKQVSSARDERRARKLYLKVQKDKQRIGDPHEYFAQGRR